MSESHKKPFFLPPPPSSFANWRRELFLTPLFIGRLQNEKRHWVANNDFIMMHLTSSFFPRIKTQAYPGPIIIILSFLSFLFFSGHLQAQILVGPVAGGQLGWISFNDKSNNDLYTTTPYVGFHAGLSISFRVQKKLFLQSSVLYYQRGKTLEGKLDRILKQEADYKYIDLPILFTREFKAKFGKGKFFKWHLGAGPNVSYWLSGKGLFKNSDLNENGINPPNYDLPYEVTFGKDPQTVKQGEMNVETPNRIQLGLLLSCGLIFEPVGLNKFMISARYEIGQSFMSPTSKGDFGLPGVVYYQDDLQTRNQGLALSLHYFIDLKPAERNKGKSTIKKKK
jgi:Outer membrane protein beta-barrel domain